MCAESTFPRAASTCCWAEATVLWNWITSYSGINPALARAFEFSSSDC